MSDIRAFVGHSFATEDENCFRRVLEFLTTLKSALPNFEWDHAKAAEAKDVSEKVLQKIEGKNLLIGICTKKERVMAADERGILARIGIRRSYVWKPSDWIIQEIGIAIGRGMKVIILLEEGVRRSGEMQGNIEYIPFCRDSIEASFTPLLQMIKSTAPHGSETGSVAPADRLTASEEPAKDNQGINWKEPDPSWDMTTYRIAAMFAVEENDYEALSRIEEAYLATHATNRLEKAAWLSLIEFLRIRYGTGGNMEALRELYHDNLDNEHVVMTYARTLSYFDSHGAAAAVYKEAAARFGHSEAAMKCLGEAAQSLRESGDEKSANNIVLEMVAMCNKNAALEPELLEALAKFFKETDQTEWLLAVLDRHLEIDPANADRRFNLAYSSAELGLHYLAYYQYEKIPEAKRSSTAWNNLGVACLEHNMPIGAIAAYSRSVELSDTLAMSNLAKVYLRAGLLDKAKEILSQALVDPNRHKNVDSTFSEIGEAEEAEKEKSRGLISRARPVTQYLQAFGRALSIDGANAASGQWAHPKCTLQLSVIEGRIQANGSYIAKDAFNSLASLRTAVGGDSTTRKLGISIKGKWIGSAGSVFISIAEEGKRYQSLLDVIGEVTPALICYSHELDELVVFENFKMEDYKLYVMNRT